MKFGSNTINKKRTRDNRKDDLFYFLYNLTVENSNPNFPRISWNYVSFGKRCREQVCSIFFEKKNKDAPYLEKIAVAFFLSVPCSLFLHKKVTHMWS